MKIIITLGLEGSGHHALSASIKNDDIPCDQNYNYLQIIENFVFDNIIDNKFLKSQNDYKNNFTLNNNLDNFINYINNNNNSLLTINFSFPTYGRPNDDFFYKNSERRLNLYKLYNIIKDHDVHFICFKRNLYDMYISQLNRNIIDTLDNFFDVTISNLSYMSMFIDFLISEKRPITIIDYNNMNTEKYKNIISSIYPNEYINSEFEFKYSTYINDMEKTNLCLSDKFKTYSYYLRTCHNSSYFINF